MGVDAWLPVRSLVLCFPCARCFPAHNRGTRGHVAISLRLGSLVRREPSEEDPCLPQVLLWRLEALPHPLSFCPRNRNWWPSDLPISANANDVFSAVVAVAFDWWHSPFCICQPVWCSAQRVSATSFFAKFPRGGFRFSEVTSSTIVICCGYNWRTSLGTWLASLRVSDNFEHDFCPNRWQLTAELCAGTR